MTKIGKKIISAVTAVAVGVSAALVGAVGVSAASLFVPGAAVDGVRAVYGPGQIEVSWKPVASEHYAVYYIQKSNDTGAFGVWSVASTNGGYTFVIPNPSRAATYYITILPYDNNPRVYGAFSAYTLVQT